MQWVNLLILLGLLVSPSIASQYRLAVSGTSPYSLTVNEGRNVIVQNTAILTGSTNTSAKAVSASSSGRITNNGGQITAKMLTPTIAKVQIDSTSSFIGACFVTGPLDHFYGVWEYPWHESLSNTNVSFELSGVGNMDGINWDNTRAPFFLTSAGYAVYTDTLAMGSYDFSTPGGVQFVFNSSSLVYYIILPDSPSNFKSLIKQYTQLSSRIQMPATSGFGPTFWSDNFEQDFHGSVTNAQENYYDVVDHLYYNQIRASSMFADRPYGTGNMSFGNFDFDPAYYPSPKQFIANLSAYGLDFQVWVANRAFLDTELYNVSLANNWLFPGYNAENFLGPALNLSIPAAYHWFQQRLQAYTDLGVKGYKIDRGEEGEMPDWEQNIQNTLFENLCHDSQATAWPSLPGKPLRFYNFARSAVDRARSHTYIWNGDSHSNFSGLAYSIAVHTGGGSTMVSLGVDAAPVYVRAGAIVPRGDVYRGNNVWTEDWRPRLTVEVYPSFEVPRSEFAYYDEEGDREVVITMRTEKEGGCVRVCYGDLGVEGSLVVFVRGGERRVELERGGGEAVLGGVESLFG